MQTKQGPRHGIFRIHFYACFLLGFFQAAVCTAAPSIFDDDWVPPKREVPARPVEPTPASKPPAEDHPAVKPPPADPVKPAAPAQESSQEKNARHAIPAAAELARSRGQFNELFAQQLADHTLAGRRKLAKALLDAVPQTSDNPVDQYALLGGAINAAKEGASVHLCFQAAELMAKHYDVDALAVKTKAALSMPLRADNPANAAENVREAVDLLDPLIAEEDFTSAARLCSQIKPLMANDSTLTPVLTKYIHEIELLRLQRERIRPVLEKLAKSPDDPAANSFAGSYFCFTRGLWSKGLPMLAKGSDLELKKLATQEIADGQKLDSASQLGDAWWKIGERQSETLRVKTLQHAAGFYKLVVASTTGLRRVLLDKRIREAQIPDEPGHVDLLALLSHGGHVVRGTVKFQNGILSNGGTSNLLIEFPYVAPPEYDYSVTFRAAENGEFMQIQTGGGHQFSWRMEGQWAWFEVLDSGKFGRFGGGPKDKWMVAGERYTCDIKVRNDGLEVFLNDKKVTSYKTDYTGVHLLGDLKMSRTDTLGLKIPPGFEIEAASVLEVMGQGRILRGK